MKKALLSICMLFLTISCSLESEFSLPNDENINPKLIGEWYSEDYQEDKLTIKKHGKKTYKLLLKDKEKTEELISFSKTIQGFQIMNIKTIDNNKTTNTFYGFKVTGNSLTFSEVNKNFGKKEFKSKTELLAYFEKNVQEDNFFINSIGLKRK